MKFLFSFYQLLQKYRARKGYANCSQVGRQLLPSVAVVHPGLGQRRVLLPLVASVLAHTFPVGFLWLLAVGGNEFKSLLKYDEFK
jgi:hypothetical protein